MSNKAKVTVVIPNYNGLKFMDPCFKALDLQLCRDFDILVVDNGSTDGSVEWLKEHEIPSIFLEKNTGFSGAVNVGIKASKTPYVILLNNDTEPDCHYIGEMIKAIERSPEIFSCLCHINPPSNKGRTPYYSGLFNTFSSPCKTTSVTVILCLLA